MPSYIINNYNSLNNKEITAISHDTNIATVAVDDGEITVTEKLKGSTTIDVFAKETNNYLESNITSINVEVKDVDPILDNNSWATIKEVAAKGEGHLYWNIGDCKKITLAAGQLGQYNISRPTDYYVYIIGFDHNKSFEGTGIQFSCFKQMNTKNDTCLYYEKDVYGNGAFGEFYPCWTVQNIEDTDRYKSYDQWDNGPLRNHILNNNPNGTPITNEDKTLRSNIKHVGKLPIGCKSLYDLLPEDLRQSMKPLKKYTACSKKYSPSVNDISKDVDLYEDEIKLWADMPKLESNSNTIGAWITEDYLTLPSLIEVFGENGKYRYYSYTNNMSVGERLNQKQYEYYAKGNSKIRYVNGIGAPWALRDTYRGNNFGSKYCRVTGYSESRGTVNTEELPIFEFVNKTPAGLFDVYSFSTVGIAPIFMIG